MKFQYTDAALQELVNFQAQQKGLLEKLISERKFVFGDETVEVTASDIKEASYFIRAIRPQIARFSSVRMISQIYIFLGLLITLGAFFYPYIQTMFHENRVQAMALFTGIFITLLGIFTGYWYRLRIRRYDSIRRDLNSDNDKTKS